jgi:hypothetical protein
MMWQSLAASVGLGLYDRKLWGLNENPRPFEELVSSLGAPGNGGWKDTCMHGRWRGHEVLLGCVWRDYSILTDGISSLLANPISSTQCAAKIDPPLWLGLTLFRDTSVKRLQSAPFADAYAWGGAHPRAVELLSMVESRLRHASSAILANGLRILLKDTFVMTARGGVVDTPGELEALVEPAVLLAQVLQEVHRSMGLAAWQKELLAHWEPVAAHHGLQLHAESLTMTGQVDGVHVVLRVVPDAGTGAATQLLVQLSRPVGVGLRVLRTGDFEWLQRVGMQDIEVGDAEFDREFIVQGNPPDAVKQLLDAEARGHLTALVQHGAIVDLHDGGLVLRFPRALGGREAEEALTDALVAVHRLSPKLGGAAYRDAR